MQPNESESHRQQMRTVLFMGAVNWIRVIFAAAQRGQRCTGLMVRMGYCKGPQGPRPPANTVPEGFVVDTGDK